MAYGKVDCPYCKANIEIDHDGGFEEGAKFEHQCQVCDMRFVYQMSISIDFDVQKADCLNDKPHDYQKTHTYPECQSRMECTMCGDSEPIPQEEICPGKDKCAFCPFKGTAH